MATSSTSTFAGDKKVGQSLLGKAERRLIDWGIPKVPKPIMSHHLTSMTVVWSALTIVFGWLATKDLVWLHAISVMVAGQWLTDSFDGSLGKFRKQGLVKWGFYMDHLLDFLFQGSIVIAYSFLVRAEWLEFLFLVLLLIGSATMAVSFLSFAATNQFRIRVLRHWADRDPNRIHRAEHLRVLRRNRPVQLGRAGHRGAERSGVPRARRTIEPQPLAARLRHER